MTTKTYNGCANRDTWLVKLHIMNDQGNYNEMKQEARYILTLKGYDFKEILRDNFAYSDPIKWENVRIGEIRNFIKDFIKDHKGEIK